MTKNDILMIKGVRRVCETGIHSYNSTRVVLIYISPWWAWSSKRRRRIEDAFHRRMPGLLRYELKTWWY